MELPDLSTLVPSAGVLGLLAWLIVHFVRQGGADRSQYLAQITEIRTSHDAQVESLISRHDRTVADLREQITALRSDLDQLRVDLEAARKARWVAEDNAAKWRRRAEGVADGR